jgi:hypothetical protein
MEIGFIGVRCSNRISTIPVVYRLPAILSHPVNETIELNRLLKMNNIVLRTCLIKTQQEVCFKKKIKHLNTCLLAEFDNVGVCYAT